MDSDQILFVLWVIVSPIWRVLCKIKMESEFKTLGYFSDLSRSICVQLSKHTLFRIFTLCCCIAPAQASAQIHSFFFLLGVNHQPPREKRSKLVCTIILAFEWTLRFCDINNFWSTQLHIHMMLENGAWNRNTTLCEIYHKLKNLIWIDLQGMYIYAPAGALVRSMVQKDIYIFESFKLLTLLNVNS